MRAGDLDRRITIEAYVITGHDPFNTPIGAWQPIGAVWAQVLQETGSEFIRAETIESDRKVVFRIRWQAGLSVEHRVIYDDREHNIHQVKELGRREGIELHATSAG
jgi:SPP1 family predicted phage head-tail adaptor